MKISLKNIIYRIVFSVCLLITMDVYAQTKDTTKANPLPKLIQLNLDSPDYQSIFNGSPETISFYSGLVTLKQDEKVGHHNTDEYEEILVIFSGEGQMIFENGNTMNLKYGVIAYCPPHTEHDVKCTSPVPLKYLYIASKTK